MAIPGEHIHPEVPGSIEQSRKAVDSFINFTRGVLLHESHALGVEWEHEMNLLYGNEELLRVTKNEAYKGKPGVQDELRLAYENGGLILLRATFFIHLVEHTGIQESMGEAAQIAIERIISFE